MIALLGQALTRSKRPAKGSHMMVRRRFGTSWGGLDSGLRGSLVGGRPKGATSMAFLVNMIWTELKMLVVV